MIRPLLEYGNVLFINCTAAQAKQIENVQICAGSVISAAMNTTSHAKILKELGYDTLESRRTEHQLTLFYKMKHNLTPEYITKLVPSNRDDGTRYTLRRPFDHKLIATRTERYRKSFLPSAVTKWNSLPTTIKNAENLSIFKSRYAKQYHTKNVKYFSYGDKKSNVTLSRFRMGFSKLNSDLFIRNLIDPFTQMQLWI